jgi:hypothetical protein
VYLLSGTVTIDRCNSCTAVPKYVSRHEAGAWSVRDKCVKRGAGSSSLCTSFDLHVHHHHPVSKLHRICAFLQIPTALLPMTWWQDRSIQPIHPLSWVQLPAAVCTKRCQRQQLLLLPQQQPSQLPGTAAGSTAADYSRHWHRICRCYRSRCHCHALIGHCSPPPSTMAPRHHAAGAQQQLGTGPMDGCTAPCQHCCCLRGIAGHVHSRGAPKPRLLHCLLCFQGCCCCFKCVGCRVAVLQMLHFAPYGLITRALHSHMQWEHTVQYIQARHRAQVLVNAKFQHV